MTPHMGPSMYDRIKRHYNLLQELPLERSFKPREHDLTGFDINTLLTENVIQRETIDGRYKFTDRAKKEFEDYEPAVESPCEHRGIRNLGDGTYSCAVDDCNVTFGREQAADILGVDA